ncbi:hypothetical protein [Candidatus Solincola sp.]|nr:hypothetical protein [Actinomycetota bacterium]MDI7251181.1 hypothetical protein [Actinomycetota bacterium]
MLVERGWFIPTLQFGPHDVFLVEDWEDTPVGPYRAIFHFTPDDFRTLYVSGEESGDLVSGIHRFDRRVVTPIVSRRVDGRWVIEADTGERGELRMEVEYGETMPLRVVNSIAPRIPDGVARNPLYCRLLPRLSAPLLGTDPGQRIAGVTELGRRSRFRLHRIYKVTGARCAWDGRDLGPLRDCLYRHDMGDFRPTSRAVVSYLELYVD